jgi:ribonucleoside-diphosphate reductase alpha chain
VNKRWAKTLGINHTGHVCVVKPSGTVSILTGTSSGIHPRYGSYYIRRVRNDKKDPLSKLMIEEGIPYVDEGDKYVFSFYVKSPDHAIVQKEIGAMKQLELWKIYKECWCDGNPSQTIYYTDNDYFAIADWLWTNWDTVGGLSFFPYSDPSEGIYANAPLEEITEEEYIEGMRTFPKFIKWDTLPIYEKEDETTSSQEFACAGGKCEL